MIARRGLRLPAERGEDLPNPRWSARPARSRGVSQSVPTASLLSAWKRVVALCFGDHAHAEVCQAAVRPLPMLKPVRHSPDALSLLGTACKRSWTGSSPNTSRLIKVWSRARYRARRAARLVASSLPPWPPASAHGRSETLRVSYHTCREISASRFHSNHGHGAGQPSSARSRSVRPEIKLGPECARARQPIRPENDRPSGPRWWLGSRPLPLGTR